MTGYIYKITNLENSKIYQVRHPETTKLDGENT